MKSALPIVALASLVFVVAAGSSDRVLATSTTNASAATTFGGVLRTPRPFDPRTDRFYPDSTPELNLANRPGVRLPNVCAQRAKHGFGGHPWTATCRSYEDTYVVGDQSNDTRSRN